MKLDRANPLQDRFRGALLGTMVGDALGMPVEGMHRGAIEARYGCVREMLPGRMGAGTYTDDTEMMIGLAEGLLESPGQIDRDRIARRFAENYDPRRGYGGNTRKILRAIRDGMPWREAVEAYPLPGGSLANGAAMRVAPIALAFHGDRERVATGARIQGEVTGHTHAEAVFGAILQAQSVNRAVDHGSKGEPFDAEEFVASMLGAGPTEFDRALDWIRSHLSAEPAEAVDYIGVSGRSSQSVPAALWAFLSRQDDAEEAVVRAVNLGGDADTIGAMTGAIAGAFHGAGVLPKRWVDSLENGPKGRDYVIGLADCLWGSGRPEENHLSLTGVIDLLYKGKTKS